MEEYEKWDEKYCLIILGKRKIVGWEKDGDEKEE